MHNSDRAGFTIFCVAIAFIGFVGGAFVVLTRTFPYAYLNDAHKAAHALIAQRSSTDLYTETHLWREARRDDRGVTINDPSRTYAGVTLYTSGDGTHANLVDMEGNVVYRWQLPYRAIWDKNPSGRDPRPEDRIYWDKARLLPNGDLIVVITADNDTPWGYGMIRIDRDSKLVWGYHGATHHDLDIMPNGDVVTLTHEFSDRPLPGMDWLERPWLEDFVVTVDGKSGRELSKVSLAQAYLNSPYVEQLYSSPGYAAADPLHANSVQFLDERLANAFPPAAGKRQVMVSFRNLSAIALVDPQTGDMHWAQRGPWLVQHDAHVLPNGNFTLFDNAANYQRHNLSRILEISPTSQAIVWSYRGDDTHPFESFVRSSAQVLPNGNRLINESDGGRLFEITPEGTIVWEFVNPVRGGDQDRYIPIVSSGQRFAYDYFDADFRAAIGHH